MYCIYFTDKVNILLEQKRLTLPEHMSSPLFSNTPLEFDEITKNKRRFNRYKDVSLSSTWYCCSFLPFALHWSGTSRLLFAYEHIIFLQNCYINIQDLQLSVHITTNVVSSNPSQAGVVYSIQHYVIQFVSDAAGQWFSLVSSTNKTDRHDIAVILL